MLLLLQRINMVTKTENDFLDLATELKAEATAFPLDKACMLSMNLPPRRDIEINGSLLRIQFSITPLGRRKAWLLSVGDLKFDAVDSKTVEQIRQAFFESKKYQELPAAHNIRRFVVIED